MARLGGGRRISPWYVCLGRTARAFATHPAAQRLPETATNRALSAAAGRPLDAVAGAAWLTPEAAEIILAGSREPTAATDLEWPALILRHDPSRLRGLRCEGLEWETPDFHAAEIIGRRRTGGVDPRHLRHPRHVGGPVAAGGGVGRRVGAGAERRTQGRFPLAVFDRRGD